MSDYIEVCELCDIAGCHHLRDKPDPKHARIAALAAEVTRLRDELATVTAERDDAQDEAEELGRNQEIISAAFECDLWVGVRKLLDETGFDWSGDAQTEGVSAADACEHLAETLRCMDDAEKRLRARAEAAEAARDAARADGVAEGLRDMRLWHEKEIADLERQIEANNDFAHRSGGRGVASEANDLCRTGIFYHRSALDQIARIALIPAPAKPADGPRRASGPIDPEQGFATTGAEARWIADTDAGVYDDAPPAPREGGEV